MVMMALEGLEKVLQVGEEAAIRANGTGSNPHAALVDTAKVEALQVRQSIDGVEMRWGGGLERREHLAVFANHVSTYACAVSHVMHSILNQVPFLVWFGLPYQSSTVVHGSYAIHYIWGGVCLATL